jgi:hypothetical protein
VRIASTSCRSISGLSTEWRSGAKIKKTAVLQQKQQAAGAARLAVAAAR